MIALNFIWNSNEILATIDLPFVHAFSLRYYSLMFIVAFSLGWYLTKKIYLNGDIETKNSVTANYLENEKLICYFIIKKDEDDDSILVITSVI